MNFCLHYRLDNNFKIGIIKGITNTEYELKYIGSKKREQYRLEKISTLENKIEELNIILENCDSYGRAFFPK